MTDQLDVALLLTQDHREVESRPRSTFIRHEWLMIAPRVTDDRLVGQAVGAPVTRPANRAAPASVGGLTRLGVGDVLDDAADLPGVLASQLRRTPVVLCRLVMPRLVSPSPEAFAQRGLLLEGLGRGPEGVLGHGGLL